MGEKANYSHLLKSDRCNRNWLCSRGREHFAVSLYQPLSRLTGGVWVSILREKLSTPLPVTLAPPARAWGLVRWRVRAFVRASGRWRREWRKSLYGNRARHGGRRECNAGMPPHPHSLSSDEPVPLPWAPSNQLRLQVELSNTLSFLRAEFLAATDSVINAQQRLALVERIACYTVALRSMTIPSLGPELWSRSTNSIWSSRLNTLSRTPTRKTYASGAGPRRQSSRKQRKTCLRRKLAD